MAIRRIKSKKRKNPARARSLVANPRRKRRKNAMAMKSHKNPKHKRRHKRKRNPGGLGQVFSSDNLQMVANVGIGAAAGVVVAYFGGRAMFAETNDDGKTYQPTKYAKENPTVAAVTPHAVVALLGLVGGVMLENKTAKGIAYGMAAAGVTGAVVAGVGPSIIKALEGKKDDEETPEPTTTASDAEGYLRGYLPALNVYGMGGAFGHGQSAGAYLGFDAAGQPSGYFIEGSQRMSGFQGF